MNKYHPDKYLYTSKTKIDSITQAIKTNLDKPMNSTSFYRKLLPLIASIRNGHTSISPNTDYLNHLKKEAPRCPLSFYCRNDSVFLFRNASNENNIKDGSLITKINDKNAITFINKVAKLSGTDGYSPSLPMLKASRYFVSYYALYFGTPDEFKISYLNHSGQATTTIVKNIPLNDIKTNLAKRYDGYSNKDNKPYYLEIKDSTAILTISSFQPKKERSFYRFLENAFKNIQSKNIKHLIIDVRGNGGGYPESANRLLSYFVPEKVKTTQSAYALVNRLNEPNHFIKNGYYKHFNRKYLRYKDGFYHTNDVRRSIIKPRKTFFNGKVYILQDARSASATGDFLGLAYSYSNAIFIGRESGSNPVTQVATDIVTLVLPHSKVILQFPLIKTELNVTFSNNGRGLIPQYHIEPTIEEILSGKDMDLAKAMELIGIRE